MLAKLERELERFRSAKFRWDQSDHATNFVVTAWHLADWVFKAIASHPIKSELARKHGGISIDQFDDAAFNRWAATECRALEYCRVIGTTSKHAGIRRDAPDVDTAISLGPVTMTRWPTEEEPVTFEWVSVDWAFKVIDGKQRIPAVDAFAQVLKFWTDFIYANKIR